MDVIESIQNTRGQYLRPYQKTGVERMAKWQHCLLADSPGLGKTAQVLALMKVLSLEHVLIICPASVKLGWLRQIKDWLPVQWQYGVQVLESRADVVQPFAKITIVNYDLIIHSNIFHQLIAREYDLLVCDEAHKLKNMKSRRTQAVLSNTGLVRKCRRSVMVTGTPILNRPIELYPLLKVLSPKTIEPYSRYDRYARRFCDAYQDGFTLNVSGASHTDDLNSRLRSTYMIRRTENDVKLELPAKRYEIYYVQQNTETHVELRKLEAVTKRDFTYNPSSAGDDHIATARRKIAEKKVQVCQEYIQDYVEKNEKTTIFAYHRSVIDNLQAMLSIWTPVVLQGGMSSRAKDQVIQKFQTDPKVKVFIGQIDAAGEGIDGLQTICSNILFLECSWGPEVIKQAIARLHRMGQTKPVLVQFFVWEDSIEEHVMRVALDKMDIIKSLLK